MGIEPTDVITLQDKDLRKSDNSSAAKSGAVSVDVVLAMLAALSPEDRERLRTALTQGNPPA